MKRQLAWILVLWLVSAALMLTVPGCDDDDVFYLPCDDEIADEDEDDERPWIKH